MNEKDNLLSLISIEVFINNVDIKFNIECYLPCIVFRLLDYPAVSISYFDQWQIEEFYNLKKEYSNLSWNQLYKFHSINGKINFKRGKSCLFKTYFKTLYKHLLNVPLFILLIDQINDDNTNKSHFIGSCNIKLNELIEKLNQKIIKYGYDIPIVEQDIFHCILFNLMGVQIGTCDVAVRFCHYGTTILTHLPMLNNEQMIKIDKKPPISTKDQVTKPSSSSPPPPLTDTIVKHIHFVNDKKDIGLQLSRSDLPLSSNNNKSVQTRWTSTKTRSKNPYLHPIEDSLSDDLSIDFYQPPPLYYNSNSDFLHIMKPTTIKVFEKAKENRLSYLASIPMTSFDDNDENKKPLVKEKVISNVPSSLINPQTKIISKQQILTKDFLHNFPLLRSLVEEALALQQYQNDISTSVRPVIFDERSHSAVQHKQKNIKQILVRSKSTTNIRSIPTKSVIVTKNINNTRQLYSPLQKTNQMKKIIKTKTEIRNLVDRLSKPKFNKKIEQEIAKINQYVSIQEPVIVNPHLPSKSISTKSTNTTPKPSPSYGTTRAHRLMIEFSRARRAAFEHQPTNASKSHISNNHIPLSSPEISNINAVTHSPLLNKVDIDISTVEKNSIQQPLIVIISKNSNSTIKSPSTTGQDVTLKLNETITKIKSSTSEPIISEDNQENNEKDDDLAFSITDITDYFTDGNDSSTRPPTRQST